MERSTSPYKDTAFLAESGEDWQTVLSNYAELWQIYLQGMQKLGQLWAEPLWRSLELANSAAVGKGFASSDINNLYWDIYEKTFGSFLLSPTLGYTREFNHKLLKSFDTWINFSKANFDYQNLLLNVWTKAFEELMRELVSSQKKGEKIQTWQQSLEVWSNVFDRVFAETFRSEDALQIRGKLLSAGMNNRLQQQQLMEVFLKMNDLPTRSEVDEIHRSIYELRKEIKSLKKTLTKS